MTREFSAMRMIPLLFTVLFLLAPPAWADKHKPPPNPQDAQDVFRVEKYLNARRDISAQFIQTTDSGQTVTGTVLIKRPGKMNLAYDPPMKDFIIADGSFVYLWDGELEHSTTIPIGDSLADLILRNNVRLSGDVQVERIERGAAKLEITVRQASDPGNGAMTLLFEDYPLILHGWRVEDAQGRSTTIALQDMRENIDLPARKFIFVPPKLGTSAKHDKPINQK